MEHIVYDLLRKFEAGKINRRELARSLTVAAGAVAMGGAPAAGAEDGSLKTLSINHISYRVSHFPKTRDFYAGLMGVKVSGDTGTKCRLTVGEVGITLQPGEDERTRKTPMIDHIAYNMDATKDQILAAAKRRGIQVEHGINHPPEVNAKKVEAGVQFIDPDGFHVTLLPKK